jgi:uncharacterized membrane protein YbhN (UPF0104 family)
MEIRTNEYLLLTAAFLLSLLSVSLWFSVGHDAEAFIGLWVPSIFAFGGYFKTLIKRNKHATAVLPVPCRLSRNTYSGRQLGLHNLRG